MITAAGLLGLQCGKKEDAKNATFHKNEKENKLAASSTLKDEKDRYNVEHIRDESNERSWCEGKSGDGIGEFVKITYLDGKRKAIRLFVVNGFGDKKFFKMNNRVRDLDVNGRIVTLKDIPGIQEIPLNPQIIADEFVFTIKSVYPGTKWKDTCISELSFAPVGVSEYNSGGDDSKYMMMINGAGKGDAGAEDVKKALDAGADINFVYRPKITSAPNESMFEETALINALIAGDRFLIDQILKMKADPSICAKPLMDGVSLRCPVDAAIMGGNADYAELFIKSYKVKSGSIRTLIRNLEKVKHPENLLKLMIDTGFNVNAGGDGGDPGDYPLCYAKAKKKTKIIEMLKAAGAACEADQYK